MTTYGRALALAHQLDRPWQPLAFPSQPCPHPVKSTLVGGDGKTYVYCTNCGLILHAR